VLEKFGFDPKTMPMKPMSVEQCVSEGLSGLLKNRSRIVRAPKGCNETGPWFRRHDEYDKR
jgi:predicted dithiol-disulfide oxidoreductase (DUF899 family)